MNEENANVIEEHFLKNQRQLAESVRNKLKNILYLPALEFAVVKVSDLEEMRDCMEQLNVLRLANKTW
jgi:hypothetical protein